MKKNTLLALLILIGYSLFAQKKLGKEFFKADYLPNLSRKLSHTTLNDTLQIAYLGGSITEQNNGWRDQSFAWFKKSYPKSNFNQIKAAVGGTGSLLGVFRFDKHVVSKEPDLLFIEFAVNDLKESRESILENFDGIIQKTWRANPFTDICIIFTFNEEMLKDYSKGQLPQSIKAMKQIADWYKIPTINYGLSILNKLNKKKLFVKGPKPVSGDSTYFSSDGVHPFTGTGHVYYTQTLTKYLPRLLAKQKKFSHNKPVYFSEKLINAGFVEGKNFMVAKGISLSSTIKFEDRITNLATNIIALKDTLQSLEFQFTGDRIGFMDVIGPSSAAIDVYIDKQPPRHIERFDSYCTFNRIHWFFIDGLTNADHRIKIKLSENQPNKLKILNVANHLFAGNNDYDKFEWSVSKILASDTKSVIRIKK